MNLLEELSRNEPSCLGQELYAFAASIYPICRSITGDGIRATLAAIQNRIPLNVSDIPSGTAVFDWTIPREWNISDAYIKNAGGNRIVDFREHNLHVVNYSTPVHAVMPLSKLRPHLFSLPAFPDRIPYRTTYYEENWGFCLSHRQLQSLEEGEYEVCIDSSLADGTLTYGEYYIPGNSSDEVLFSSHICHPSLANDNLSGIAIATFLAQFLSGRTLRYSYRFVFAPGTIGAISWLASNRDAAKRICNGLVLTCVGDEGPFHYKKSRRGNAQIDRAMARVLRDSGEEFTLLDFAPYGYDERQFCSPGFNLSVGCLMRSVWGTFPEYHTSADDLSFIQPLALAKSARICVALVDSLESDVRYVRQNPYCEPQLGRRNLYDSSGPDARTANLARLWILNLSDGDYSLSDIAERSGLPFSAIQEAARTLRLAGLLSPVGASLHDD